MQKKLPETVLDPSKYTVGWICAVRLEFTVARLCLDKEHSDLKFTRKGDNNTYQLGEIGDHNVVIACCPVGGYGICNATAVVKDMVATFPNVRFCLMVGIGGGAPSPKADIRLGDVVAGVPQNDANGGVFQYDFGKARQGQAFEHTGYLNKPPRVLLTAINKLESEWELAKEGNGIGTFIDAIINNPDRNDKFRAKYGRPSTSSDVLYVSDFLHPSEAAKSGSPCIEVCGSDPETLVLRQPRKETNDPVIHYGLIASGNQVVKDALLRDELVAAKNVLCFEMEAAGLMDNLPCLAVRGICDYSDSHKNNQWQGYSAMCAAAYASKLLHFVAAEAVEGTLKVVEVIQNSLDEIKETLHQVEAHTGHTNESVNSFQHMEHRKDVERWLVAPDASPNFNTACEKRYGDSGSWLLNGAAYSRWKSQEKSFLWLHGLSGSGKTVLSSSIINDISQTQPNDLLLYFFFDFKEAAKQTMDGMMRALIHQLSVQTKRTESRGHLSKLYTSCGEGSKQPSLTQLSKCFHSMLEEENGEVWIVLDAMDECTSRKSTQVTKDLLGWIKGFQASLQQANVHLLTTSRPEKDIESALTEWTDCRNLVEIRSDLVCDDIRQFITHVIAFSDGFKKLRDHKDMQLQNLIVKTLAEKAGAMFRWVTCQLDVLENCFSKPDVLEALSSLPTTLDDTYRRIVAGIKPELLKKAIRMLQFLIYVDQPISLKAMVEVVAVDPAQSPPFYPANKFWEEEDLLRCCSSLVAFDKTSKRLALSHFSVKEYLISERFASDSNVSAEFRVELNESRANVVISNICLSYLSTLRWNRQRGSYTGREYVPEYPGTSYHKEGDLPFAIIAGRIWEDKAEYCEADESVRKRILGFFCEPERFTEWAHFDNEVRAEDKNHIRWEFLPEPESMLQSNCPEYLGVLLYNASIRGLKHVAASLLSDHGADPNICLVAKHTRVYVNPLQATTSRHKHSVIQILLDGGADVSAEGCEYGSVLQAASACGDEALVRLFLSRGVGVNTMGGKFGSALHGAVSGGHEKVVRNLIQNGANINSQWEKTGSPLHTAISKGFETLARILIDSGADVDAACMEYGSVIQLAVRKGLKKIARLLVERGCNANVALKAAVSSGDLQLLELAIRRGASVNTDYGGEGGTALHIAALHGHKDIADYLLANGAQINAVGGKYGTALQAAAYGNQKPDIRYDIITDSKESKSTVEEEDSSKKLGCDISKGTKDTKQIRHGISKDTKKRTARREQAPNNTARESREKMVKLLIDHGAAVNIEGGEFGSALQAAARHGDEVNVRLLLEKGADVNLKGGEYGSALAAAAYQGCETVVRLLVENGADVDDTDGKHDPAIKVVNKHKLASCNKIERSRISKLLNDRKTELEQVAVA